MNHELYAQDDLVIIFRAVLLYAEGLSLCSA